MRDMPSDNNTINQVVYSKKINKAKLARLVAIQCIFSKISNPTEQEIDEIIFYLLDSFKKHKSYQILADSDMKILVKLARSVSENLDSIKILASKYIAKEWRFERLGKAIQAILYVSCYDILHTTEDVAAVMNQYLEIAKELNHDGEVGFINSVLDQVAKERLL